MARRRSALGHALHRYLALEWQAHVVIVLALLAMVYAQLALPLFWGSGDPLDHYRMARLFLHLPGGRYVPQRPPGMALFLILTGVAWLDTFKFMIVLYAAMSVAIPVLIYVILRRYSASWGMVAALIAIAGAVPYAYSRVMWPEQLFHFLHFVVLALIAAYFARPANPRLPYAIALGVFGLNLVRPVAALYYWIFLLCAVALVRRPLRHALLASVIYVGLTGGWALADRYYGASMFPTVYQPETLAQRLFGEVYFSGGPYQFVPQRPPAPAIRAEDGPASARLHEALRWLIRNSPDLWQQPMIERPYLLFARFAGRPEALAQAAVSRPNFAYFDFLRHALQARDGAQESERVMYRIAAEHGRTGIGGVAGYFAHSPTKLLVGGLPPSGGRYLLDMFYYVRLRKELGHVYSLNVVTSQLIQAWHGPATTEFLRAVAMFINAYPYYWEHTNAALAKYEHNPYGLFQRIFDADTHTPDGTYEALYLDALNKYYGVGPADRLLGQVALETLRTYPSSIALFWDNLLQVALIRPLGDVKERDRGAGDFWLTILTNRGDLHGDLVDDMKRNDTTGLAPHLAAELHTTAHYDRRVSLLYYALHQWAPLFVIASLVSFGFCLLGPAWRLAVFLAAAYLYHVAGIAVFGNLGDPRYEDVFVLLPVMLACLGACSAVMILRSRQTVDAPD